MLNDSQQRKAMLLSLLMVMLAQTAYIEAYRGWQPIVELQEDENDVLRVDSPSVCAAASHTSGTEIHVDVVEGDDTYPGTTNCPKASLGAAVTLATNEASSNPEIVLHAGLYHENISVSNLDNLLIRAATGEHVVFDGTRSITEDLGGVWGVADSDGVQEVTLTEDGWQLFLDHEEQVPARWPNAGFDNETVFNRSYWAEGTLTNSNNAYTKGWLTDAGPETGVHTGLNETINATGLDPVGAIAVMNLGSFRSNSRIITDWNAGNGTFAYDSNGVGWKTKHHAYFLEGKRELIDQDGEWWFNNTNDRLHYKTPSGQDANNLDLRVKVQPFAISVDGSNGVTIQGIDFFGTTVNFNNCDGCSFTNSTLEYPSTSKRGLGIAGESEDDRWMTRFYRSTNTFVDRISITNTDGGAIEFQGSPGQTNNNTVNNSYFHAIDWSAADQKGLMVTIYEGGRDMYFTNNTIHLTGASSVLSIGDAPKVFYNEVWDVGHLQTDGAVVQVMQGEAPGAEIAYNWIHDVIKYGARFDAPIGQAGTGANGTMHHNVIWNAAGGLMVKGDYHDINNNTVFNSSGKNDMIILTDNDVNNGNSTIHQNAADKMADHRSDSWSLHPLPAGTYWNNWNGYVNTTDTVWNQLVDPANRDFRPKVNSHLDNMSAGAYEAGVSNPWTAGISWTYSTPSAPVAGCMLDYADNYDADVTLSDGSCIFSSYTPPSALDLRLHLDPNNASSYSGSGTNLADLSGFNNNGTIDSAGPDWDSDFTRFDYDGSCTGSAGNYDCDEIDVPDSTSLRPGGNDWSVAIWANASALQGSVILGAFDDGGTTSDVGWAIRLRASTGGLYATVGTTSNNSAAWTTDASINTGRWYHVVMVADPGNIIRLYVDGQNVANGSLSGSGNLRNVSNNLFLGSYNGGEENQPFDGQIGSVMAFADALNTTTINQIYNASKGVYSNTTTLSFPQSSPTLFLGQAYSFPISVANGEITTSYSLTGTLPSGMNFESSNGTVWGTPTASMSTTAYTVSANNSAGSYSTSFSLTSQHVAPYDLVYSPENMTLEKGTAMTTNTPSVSGGTITSWEISPSVPSGLSFSTLTGAIGGTPSALQTTATTYTIWANNSGGSASAQVNITINDAAPNSLSYTPQNITLEKGTAMTTNTPSVSGGAVTSWEISPSTPSGLVFSSSTGAISGTPSVLQTTTTTYTIWANNSGGSASAQVNITINDVIPNALGYTPENMTLEKGTAMTTNTPSASGGAVTSWEISPSLPSGLSFSTSTGALSGTPSVLQTTAITYTIWANNSGGSTSAQVNITINDHIASISYSTPVEISNNRPLSPTTTPTTSGGAITSWEITPSLPTGLTFGTTNGSIWGTPENVTSNETYTIWANNSGGAASATLTLNVVWTLTPSAEGAYITRNSSIASDITWEWDYDPLEAQNLSLATGEWNTCAVRDNGDVYCWGRNGNGQIGNGQSASASCGTSGHKCKDQPTLTNSLGSDAVSIAFGHQHACALLDNGVVKCWGRNNGGQLGTSGGDKDTPQTVNLGSGRTATSIYAGGHYTCAILDDASVKCWGLNDYGQLGIGSEVNTPTPTTISSLGTGRTAVSLATAFRTVCALLDDGSVKCWGEDTGGLLGNGGSTSYLTSPPASAINLGTGRTAKAITGGEFHFCAILDDDSIKCWGKGADGKLGTGTTSNKGTPTATSGSFATGRYAVAIDAGYDHTCVLLDNGQLTCWGSDSDGQLGNGATTGTKSSLQSSTVSLGTGRTAISLSAGGEHTCAQLDNGQLKCWGNRASGQVGDNGNFNNPSDRTSPSAVSFGYTYFDTGAFPSAAVSGATCAISPSLPTGMSLTSGTCTITGTPTVTATNATYTIWANVSGQSFSGQIWLEVGLNAPDISYSSSSYVYTKDIEIFTLNPTNVGGEVTTWAINATLPSGLTFGTSNGTIWGTPDTITSATTYTIWANNSADSDSLTITFTVNAAAPNFHYGGASGGGAHPLVLYLNQTMNPLTPNHASGGGAITSCSSSPSLPSGITLSSSCVLSGTPSATNSGAFYTITGTNTGGSDTASLYIEVRAYGGALTITPTNREGSVNSSISDITMSYTHQISNYGWTSGVSNSTSVVNSPTRHGIDTAIAPNGDIIAVTQQDVSGVGRVLDLNVKSKASGSWSQVFLDNTSNSGYSPSVEVDVNGAIHVIHFAISTNQLRYITNASGSWVTSNLSAAKGLNSDYFGTDLALDSQGNVHFIFSSSNPGSNQAILYYFNNQGGSWTNTTISDPSYQDAHYPSIALSGKDAVHISFYNDDGSDLVHATNENGSWSIENVSINGNIGKWSSIALNSNDDVVIASRYSNRIDVSTRIGSSGTWSTSNTGTGNRYPMYMDMQIDSNDDVHIVYRCSGTYAQVGNALGDLGYITNKTGSWTRTSEINFGAYHSSLAIDSNDDLHIMHSDSLGYSELKHTTIQGSGKGLAVVPTFAISPSLPSGLVLDWKTGTISGTPTEALANTTFTVTVTALGTTTTATFTLYVTGAPGEIAYSDISGTKGTTITPVTPSITTNGTTGSATSWAINASLPTGLTFGTSNGTIWGTPSDVEAGAVFTVWANNSAGSKSTTVNITINDVGVTAITYPSENITLTLYHTMTTVTPSTTGGTATTWGISPSLPSGMSFDSATGAISGTPENLQTTAVTYTVWANNSGGDFSDQLNITINDYEPVPLNYFGENITLDYNQTMTPLSGFELRPDLMAAGYDHSCAIKDDGTVRCWGEGANGRLGYGGSADKSSPTATSSLGTGRTAVDISAGGDHTCAVLDNGSVACWGGNAFGQLGDGTTSSRTTPTQTLSLGRPAVAVEVGWYFTCALLDNGAVSCWGKNNQGQLGRGYENASTDTHQATPGLTLPMPGGRPVLTMDISHYMACGVVDNGSIACWGQYGGGKTPSLKTFFSDANPAKDVATGRYSACGLMVNGNVTCWGTGFLGTGGSGQTANPGVIWPNLGSGRTAVHVELGRKHNCALLDNDAVKCWGDDSYGQMGNGASTSNENTPNSVSFASGVVVQDIIAGQWHTCIAAQTNEMYCWGDGVRGKLGDGSTSQNNFAGSSAKVNHFSGTNPVKAHGDITSWAVHPALPTGLALGSTNGTLWGTPTASISQTNFTIYANNSGGSSSFVLNLGVNAQAPGPFEYNPENNTLTNNTYVHLAPQFINQTTGNGSTWLVADIYNGGSGSYPGREMAILVGDTLYFDAYVHNYGFELWAHDTSNASTWRVTDINSGSGDSSPGDDGLAILVGDTLYFSANDGSSGFELWAHDTSNASTWRVADINSGSGDSDPGDYMSMLVGDTLYFSADDGSSGHELWAHDTSNASTWRVADIWSGASNSNPGVEFVMLVGDTLYFSAWDGSSGIELWAHDTSNASTWRVADINSGTGHSLPGRYMSILVGDTLYFDAEDGGSSGRELWAHDTSNASTWLVTDIRSGTGNSHPGSQMSMLVGETLYFDAYDGSSGRELWAHDTSNSSTWRVADINSGTGGSNPGQYMDTLVGDTLYFSADDGSSGHELWAHDTSNASTWRVADIYSGTGSSNPYTFPETLVGDTLYFGAKDGSSIYSELWAHDTSNGSTWEVDDIRNPGGNMAILVGDTLYFNGVTQAAGGELRAHRPSTIGYNTNTGGAVTSWAINASLPSGLTFSTTNGSIYGTPTELWTQTSYMVWANNSGGQSVAYLNITVVDELPTLSYSPENLTLTKGQSSTDLPLSATLTGSGTITSWAISPALPSGLSFGTSNGTIWGIPTVLQTTAVTYTIYANNSGGSSVGYVNITVVDELPTLSYSPENLTLTKGQSSTDLPLNATLTGPGVITSWAISPALPSGLSFGTSNGTIWGIPTVLQTIAATYSIYANNSGGSSVGYVNITIVDELPTLSYSPENLTLTKGQSSTDLPLSATLTGSGTITSWAISPALPSGLSFGTSNGTIWGTPTSLMNLKTFTIRANNSGGSSSATVNITINDEIPDISYNPDWFVLTNNTAMSPTATPTNAGGVIPSTVIDSTGDVGEYSSIVIDSYGFKHISYFDATNYKLKYATDKSGSWVHTTVNTNTQMGKYTSIAIDSEGYVHISYDYYSMSYNHLMYATDKSGSWVNTIADGSADVGSHTSIAVDSNDTVHISYHDSGSSKKNLKYATCSSSCSSASSWSNVTVDSNGDVGRYNSIAIDSNDALHISYRDSTNDDLKYATCSSSCTSASAWTNSTIDSVGNVGSRTSIAIDSNDAVHISYHDITNGDLKYATDQSGSWANTTVDSVGTVGQYTSIAIDSNDVVHISYYDSTNKDLKYASNMQSSIVSGVGGIIKFVDRDTKVGQQGTSIAVDSNGDVHISYYDAINGDLKYAALQGVHPWNVYGYSISPALPAGLSLNFTSGEISGTPTTLSSNTTYTITSRNTGGANTATITIEVVDQVPTLSYSPENLTLTKGQSSTDLPLNATLTGSGTITSWAINGTLPAGLNFGTSNGTIWGIPTVLQTTAITYTVWANNSGGSSSATVNITINDVAPSISYSNDDIVGTLNISISPHSNPTSTGGPVTSWEISPSPGPAFHFNTVNGVISGTPGMLLTRTQFTVYGNNSGGSSLAYVNVTIIDEVPTLSYSPDNLTLERSQDSSDLPLSPTLTGPGTITSWAISPALPSGLFFGTSNGTVWGTPWVLQLTAVTYTVWANNSGGSTNATVNITITDEAPDISYSPDELNLTKGLTSSDLPLTPTNSGGPTQTASFLANCRFVVVDAQGTRHVLCGRSLYSVDANGTQTVSSGLIPTLGTSFGLEIDNDGHLHIGYRTVVSSKVFLHHVSNVSGSWQSTTVYNFSISGSSTSYVQDGFRMAVGSDDSVHFTYIKVTNAGNINNLYHVSNQSGSWADAFLTATRKPTAPMLTLSETNNVPYVAFYAAPEFVVGKYESGNYTHVTAVWGVGAYKDLMVDANGALHLVYSDTSGQAGLYYGKIASGSWASSTLDYNADYVTVRLAMDSNGDLHVVGAKKGVGNKAAVAYWTNAGGSWSSTTMTQDTIPSAHLNQLDFFLDGNDLSSIVYYDGSSSHLLTGLPSTTYNYSISPALPAGLTFSTNTGTISGTPSVLMNRTMYTITATNSGGSSTTYLNITVVDQVPTVNYSPNNLTLTNNTGSSAIPLPPSVTGMGDVVNFTLNATLPNGMGFGTTNGTLWGIPTQLWPTTAYMVWANNTGGSTTAFFNLTVVDQVPTIAYTPSILTLTNNTVSADLPLAPTLTGPGEITLWALNGTLPAGLNFGTGNGTLYGTPTELWVITTYMVWANNSGGSSMTNITLKVIDQLPTLSFDVTELNLTNNTASPDLPLTPTLTGPGEILTWDIHPSLPSGLFFGSSNGTLWGIPTQLLPATNFTIFGNNTGGSATFNLTLEIVDQVPLDVQYNPGNLTLVRGVSSSDLPLVPTLTGPGEITSWEINGTLPTGLFFGATNGTLYGLATVNMTTTAYTVYANNTGGSVSTQINITVLEPMVNLSYNPFNVTLVRGVQMAAMTPVVSGGSVEIWGVSPDLPAGLSFVHGVVSGTPTVNMTTSMFTVYANNSGGNATTTINITILEPSGNLSYVPSNYTLIRNVTMASIVPTYSGGAIASWEVYPALPLGVNFSNGAFSGTPLVNMTTSMFTVYANNSGGVASATVNLTILEPVVNLTYTPANITLMRGTTMNPLLPTVSGGNASEWGLEGVLPSGVQFVNGVFSGTPIVNMTQTQYIVYANTTGGTAIAWVNITVLEPAVDFAYNPYNLTLTRNLTMTPATPIVDGNVETWGIEPALPAGLNFTNGTVSGTPEINMTTTMFTVWANTTGGPSSTTINITILEPIVDFIYNPNSLVLTRNETMNVTSPVFGTDAMAEEWGISPELPSGLNFTNGTISGTPEFNMTATVYTVWANNSGGSAAAYLTITVLEPLATVVYVPENITLTRGEDNASIVPILGGGMVASWSISPDLPEGMVFDNGSITGVPLVNSTNTTYAVSATNTGGTAVAFLNITVVEPVAVLSFNESFLAVRGETILNATLANSGGYVATWAIAPALPAGVLLWNGWLYGTPLVNLSNTTFTVWANNSGGSANITFTLEVIEPVAIIVYPDSEITLVNGVSRGRIVPILDGGVPENWTIEPALPPGLIFLNGYILGVATTNLSATTYTVWANNSGGAAFATFELTVNQPTFYARYPFTRLVLEVNETMPTLAPLYYFGDNQNPVWSIHPELPAGLQFENGRLSGKALEASNETNYTISVLGEMVPVELFVIIEVREEANNTVESVRNQTEIEQFVLPEVEEEDDSFDMYWICFPILFFIMLLGVAAINNVLALMPKDEDDEGAEDDGKEGSGA